MELYEYARPDLMSGKKILYVHGFASSGASGTVKTIHLLLPEAEVIAPDLPIEPEQAMELLLSICREEAPDLIIGTSMGGMFAEQLHGFYRILVNPAFNIADTVMKNNGLGRQEFHSPRKDGQKDFLVTKSLLEEYRECSSHCFSDPGSESEMVFGLFGLHDEMVDTFDIFASGYPNAIRFDGGHHLDDATFLHSVLPVVGWLDDRQQGRHRPVVLVSFEDVIAYVRDGGVPEAIAVNSSVKGFHKLAGDYDAYIVADPSPNEPEAWRDTVMWVGKHLGVSAWGRLVAGGRKDLLMGDYLIDAHPEKSGVKDFLGTVLPFSSGPFKTWEDVLSYFDRLRGKA